MKIFDSVIVASDLSPKFLNFWPIVSESWMKLFGIKPELALVYKDSQKSLLNELLPKIACYGIVHPLLGLPSIPLGNQAKLARFYIAGQKQEEFVSVDDIDTIHLSNVDLIKKFTGIEKDRFVAIGAETYLNTPHEGAFPAGNFSGLGSLFNKLFDIRNKSFIDFIKTFEEQSLFSYRENPYNRPKDFSDEYLIRALFEIRQMKHMIQHKQRDVDIKKVWIDRSWWPNLEAIKTHKSDYLLVNFPRPYKENSTKVNLVLEMYNFTIPETYLIDQRLFFWNLKEKFSI